MTATEFTIDLSRPAPGTPREAVLFPFDSFSIPLRKGLTLDLIASQPTRAEYNPVLVRGQPGTPDSFRIGYYGTVMQIDGQYHMWYIADGDQDQVDQEKSTPYRHICYAVSDDGVHWTRPSLGLVEYAGNRNNNLVQIEPGNIYRSCTVLYEPHDPDPARRFKLFWEGNENFGYVAFSADGLVWRASKHNPVTRFMVEQTGLLAREGMYYVVGQMGRPAGCHHRVLGVLMSPDFEHWTDAAAIGFRRDPIPPRDYDWAKAGGPQVHLGAGLWDRGNVVVGLYGQWNGPPHDEDRRLLKMNLGLVITHDGLHYIEPIPDFKMIRSEEEDWSLDSFGAPPHITQGQGFINHGEQTMTYYGQWGKTGNKQIRLAKWRRDRLGQFSPKRDLIEGQIAPPYEKLVADASPQRLLPCCITCPIILPEGGGQVFLNCSGVSDVANLTVAVLDRAFRPVPGYELADCQPVQTPGLRVPVRWRGGDRIRAAAGPIRLRIQWGGVRFEDPILYAAYVTA
ncbi:hypothetical protein [Fontivita pretiosa]|uniref:hypothetical protein n=1 Tax=Fontivita pretiosa TaxID=2989684 RepID=UPI003D1696D3